MNEVAYHLLNTFRVGQDGGQSTRQIESEADLGTFGLRGEPFKGGEQNIGYGYGLEPNGYAAAFQTRQIQ